MVRDALQTSEGTYSPETWLGGEYQPVPQLTEAVITTYDEERLPRIKDVHQSTHVPEAIESIQEVASRAAAENQHVLVLVTGVPGSGKTMVGLQSTMQLRADGYESLYPSENDPLVKVDH